jgi:hypothetical protein
LHEMEEMVSLESQAGDCFCLHWDDSLDEWRWRRVPATACSS